MRKYDFKSEVVKLFNEINNLKNNLEEASKLPENAYFLNDERIVCFPRKNGVARFPYGTDGFTIWVYSSGYISINESTFYIVLPSEEGKEPYLAFFAGEKRDNGTYNRISLLGAARNLEEGQVDRCVVYGKDSAYFLTETPSHQYAVRIYATNDKKVVMSVCSINKTNQEHEIYLSSFINALFKYADRETMETKWFKKVQYENNTFTFESHEDLDRTTHVLNFGVIKRNLHNDYLSLSNTTSRSLYAGGRENSIAVSSALYYGEFEREKNVTHFTDTGVAADIIKYNSSNNDFIREDYYIDFTHDLEEYNNLKEVEPNEFNSDLYLEEHLNKLNDKYSSTDMLNISFNEFQNKNIKDKTLNSFLKYVIYQTEYCGLAKNSGALFLGVRDVMQQIDAALMWNPKDCRNKILEVLDYIDPSGNPPRQYSIPPKGTNPRMDLRPFIDQGVWIVSTIYNYLAYTEDYSILDEEVGYYERQPQGGVIRSKIVDTVLDHLIRIMDYLVTHIDTDTNCLRAMYGDWNDALDGLGISKKGQEYGNGVSIMTTFQLYCNLDEMIELLTKINKHSELVDLYKETKEKIINGVKKHAIVSNNNQKKILHGWGEDRLYEVGGFSDCDSLSRDSLTVNAFYYISGMSVNNLIEKEHILSAYERLDSKYGLKTFHPHFEPNVKGVGRIVNLPKGTAENGATYIHATLFGILSLFKMNESRLAFKQLYKILPLTHEILTSTPFVMPNSYSYNEEAMMDGESMSDWYTGSANTLIKSLVRGLFGVNPTLDGLYLTPAKYVDTKLASCSLVVKGTLVKINYNTNYNDVNTIEINGNKQQYNGSIYIDNNTLKQNKELIIQLY